MNNEIIAFIEKRLEELKDLECSTLEYQVQVVGIIEEYEWLLEKIESNDIFI